MLPREKVLGGPGDGGFDLGQIGVDSTESWHRCGQSLLL
jgi:hypothetical protein